MDSRERLAAEVGFHGEPPGRAPGRVGRQSGRSSHTEGEPVAVGVFGEGFDQRFPDVLTFSLNPANRQVEILRGASTVLETELEGSASLEDPVVQRVDRESRGDSVEHHPSPQTPQVRAFCF